MVKAISDYLWDAVRLLHFFTRLPLPSVSYKPLSACLHAMPIAMLVLSFALWLIPLGSQAVIGQAPWIAAGLVLAAMTWLTGALHDDALSDTADGLGGGWNKERKLAIMKDSHIGAYGVAAMVLSFGLRWSAWAAILATGTANFAWLVWLIFASRWAFMPAMALLPQARAQGQAKLAGQGDVLIAAMIAALVGMIGFFIAGIWFWLVFVPAALLAYMANRQIGGVTGDIYGAMIMLTEVAVLIQWVAHA